MLQKLIHLEWDELFTREEKKSVKRAFSVETMSPEVSDDEDATRRVAIPFIWESSKMTDIKRGLDADYRESLVAQSRRQKSKVFRSTTDVVRTAPPKDIPYWAISSTYVQEWCDSSELFIYYHVWIVSLNSFCFYDSVIVFILSIYFVLFFHWIYFEMFIWIYLYLSYFKKQYLFLLHVLCC